MPFSATNLPRDREGLVEKAFDLACVAFGRDVANYPEWAPMRAAKLLCAAARRPEPDLIAATLVAFISPADLSPGRWHEGLSPRGLEIARDVTAVIRQEKTMDEADPAARVALLARASLDIAEISRRYPQADLDRPGRTGEEAVPARVPLRAAFDHYTRLFSPALGTTGEPGIEAAYTAALGAVRTRLDTPRPLGLRTPGPTWGVPDPANYLN